MIINDDQFEDLKQFIESRISQSEKRFDEKLEGKIDSVKSEIMNLRKEMLDGFSDVGEAIDGIHNQLNETKEEFDKRLTKLEQQAT